MANEENGVENGSDIALDLAGQKLNVRNIRNLNTIIGILTLVLVVLIGYAMYMHQLDTRDLNQNFVTAIKEQTIVAKDQTVAMREQNCLMRFDQKDRQERAEFCKSLAR